MEKKIKYLLEQRIGNLVQVLKQKSFKINLFLNSKKILQKFVCLLGSLLVVYFLGVTGKLLLYAYLKKDFFVHMMDSPGSEGSSDDETINDTTSNQSGSGAASDQSRNDARGHQLEAGGEQLAVEAGGEQPAAEGHPRGGGLPEETSNSIVLRVDNVDQRFEEARAAASLVARILGDENVQLTLRVGGFTGYAYAVTRIMGGIPHPTAKAVLGLSSLWIWGGLELTDRILSHRRRMEAITRRSDPNDTLDYIRRISNSSGGSTRGGSTGGGDMGTMSIGAPIGRIAGGEDNINNSRESSVPLGTSVANAASPAEDRIGTATGVRDPFSGTTIRGEQDPSFPILTGPAHRGGLPELEELQDTQANTNSNSLVINSPAEDAPWASLFKSLNTSLDGLSFVELGLFVADVSLVLLYALSFGLSLVFVRNRLIEILANRKELPFIVSKWIPFLKNRLVSNVSGAFSLYTIVLMFMLVSRVSFVLSSFDLNIEGLIYSNELKSHFFKASVAISAVYLITTLISFEVIKEKAIGLLSKYLGIPEFIKIYSKKQAPLVYMIFLFGTLFITINYLLYLFYSVLPGELEILKSFCESMDNTTKGEPCSTV
jgi:hypothetical protein